MKFFKNNSGFTLIEILVAITILAFLMFGIFQMISSGQSIKDSVVAEDNEFLSLERAMGRIESDLNQIYSPLYFSFYNKNQKRSYSQNFPQYTHDMLLIPTIQSDSPSDLLFFSTANRRRLENSKESRYSWISYSLDPSNKGTIIRRVLNRNIYVSEFDIDKFKSFSLLSNVKSFVFEFWNPKKKEFVSSLKELTRPIHLLALKVTITWVDSNKKEWISSRIVKPVWPFFNTKNEQKIYDTILKKSQRK